MGKSRYSESFKAAIVDKVRSGESVAQVSRDSGVTATSIAKWVRLHDEKPSERPWTDAERAELKALRKEVRTLKRQKEILKKATAILAQEEQL